MKNKEIYKTTIIKKGDKYLGINAFKLASDYVQTHISLTLYPITINSIYIHPLEILSIQLTLFNKIKIKIELGVGDAIKRL
mgnify:CR=1 FL=1